MPVRTTARELRLPAAVATLALALHVAVSLFVTPPGHITWDAGTYHLMVKALRETHSLTIDNGYGELRSPELVVAQLQTSGARLVSQYPDLFTLLVLPFYSLLGFRGLFLASALAFAATTGMVFLLGRRLFSDSQSGVFAAVLYAFGTFAWEYSQWPYPQALAAFWVTSALYLAVSAADRETGLGLAALAGFVAGVGCAIRLDSVLAVPAVLAAPMLALRQRIVRMFVTQGGVLVGLATLAVTNLAKFGSLNPFSYGSEQVALTAGVGYHRPLLASAAVVAAILAGALTLGRLRSAKTGAWFAVFGLLVSAAFVPEFVRTTARLAEGSYQLIFDLRARPLYPDEPGLSRSAGGALVYLGGVKKSLVQSLPYLPALVLACFGSKPPLARRAALLALVPGVYLAFFGYDGWHGSIALNLRYLTPALPCLALLAALGIQVLTTAPGFERGSRNVRPLFAAFALVLAAGTLGLRAFPPSLDAAERLLLTPPLVLAFALALVTLWLLRRGAGVALRHVVAIGIGVALGWAGAVGFGYDHPITSAHQGRHFELARSLARHLPARALVFSDYPDFLWGLVDRVDGVVIGRAEADSFQSFEPLVRSARARGRRVFVVYEERAGFRLARAKIAMRGLELRAIARIPSGPLGPLLLLEVD